ncbi:hypothetical protein [Geomicrobium sp. JCM 19055]|uniref:hypothetical protein n=1 Tax=Geomicrobium sp. JCM 19055 TaxID=1460649 RepID=UPI0026A393E5
MGTTETRPLPRRSFESLQPLQQSVGHGVKAVTAISLFFLLWELALELVLLMLFFLPPFSLVILSGWELIVSGQLFFSH